MTIPYIVMITIDKQALVDSKAHNGQKRTERIQISVALVAVYIAILQGDSLQQPHASSRKAGQPLMQAVGQQI